MTISLLFRKYHFQLLLLFWFFVTLNTFGQQNSPTLLFDGSELHLQSGGDSIYVGNILRGSHLGITIRIINKSETSFHISNVRGSCRLTIPNWPRQIIPPGGESILQLRYDTGRYGRIDRNITIHSNARNPSTILRVVGDVVPEK